MAGIFNNAEFWSGVLNRTFKLRANGWVAKSYRPTRFIETMFIEMIMFGNPNDIYDRVYIEVEPRRYVDGIIKWDDPDRTQDTRYSYKYDTTFRLSFMDGEISPFIFRVAFPEMANTGMFDVAAAPKFIEHKQPRLSKRQMRILEDRFAIYMLYDFWELEDKKYDEL